MCTELLSVPLLFSLYRFVYWMLIVRLLCVLQMCAIVPAAHFMPRWGVLQKGSIVKAGFKGIANSWISTKMFSFN